MATDTTETTFVRCPACRSLVPAVSTRCRMCGATLDAAPSESSQQPGSSRVRQKTMTTASSSDMADQVGKVREEMAGAPAEPPPQPEKKTVDPLAGYLDDEAPLDDVEQDLLDDDDFEDDFDDDFEDVQEAEEPQKAQAQPEPVLEEEPVYEEPKAKVVVEQPKTPRPAARNAAPAPSTRTAQDGAQRRFDVAQPPKRAETAAPAKENGGRETREPAAKEQTPPPQREPAAPRENGKATKEVLKKGEQLGKLYAWLVSFVDPDGSSIELREGRFFVSAAQLRPTDMVFEDETISTPHAMFTVSADDGIVIQDLKSERGVFVRESGSSAYRREYDNAELRHGDWVRFGDLEFLVSVIASTGIK